MSSRYGKPLILIYGVDLVLVDTQRAKRNNEKTTSYTTLTDSVLK